MESTFERSGKNYLHLRYYGLAFVTTEMPMDVPVSVMILLPTGEIRAALVADAYRRQGWGAFRFKEVVDDIRWGARKGFLNFPNKEIFAIVHPDNYPSNHILEETGFTCSRVDTETGVWNRWTLRLV